VTRARPLDRLGSIKLKLGVVIMAAVAVTVAVVSLGEQFDVEPWVTGPVAAVLALALVQLLAHGMTSPLREMVAAARAMAKGEYGRRVAAGSRDEVGELARAFNAMAEELAEVDRLRRDLVANASHELRTPLGALRATLENLVDGVEPVDRAALERALGQVERLGGLVEQMLDLSKLESGAVPLERERIEARELLEHAAEEWRLVLASRALRVAVVVHPDGLSLRADDARIRQVLANLVANAIRHSPEGGCIVLKASAEADGVRIEVVDGGPGIAPGEASRVFERFYRADAARSASGGGAGLGLAIARWIVELHGGAIRAEQAEPTGCRMVVELPA
jgi:signal transduction histidine kinase